MLLKLSWQPLPDSAYNPDFSLTRRVQQTYGNNSHLTVTVGWECFRTFVKSSFSASTRHLVSCPSLCSSFLVQNIIAFISSPVLPLALPSLCKLSQPSMPPAFLPSSPFSSSSSSSSLPACFLPQILGLPPCPRTSFWLCLSWSLPQIPLPLVSMLLPSPLATQFLFVVCVVALVLTLDPPCPLTSMLLCDFRGPLPIASVSAILMPPPYPSCNVEVNFFDHVVCDYLPRLGGSRGLGERDSFDPPSTLQWGEGGWEGDGGSARFLITSVPGAKAVPQVARQITL